MRSSSAACAISGENRLARDDDAKMAPAADDEQSSKKDRRPPSITSFAFALVSSRILENKPPCPFLRAFVDDEDDGSGCCCQALEMRHNERLMQIKSDEIVIK